LSAWTARLAEADARATAALVGCFGTPLTERARTAVGLWTHTGDGLVWLALGVLAWRFGVGLWALLGERIVLAAALAWCLSTILKYAIRRPRPQGAPGGFFVQLDQHAFPSGHAARVGALLTAVGPLLPWWGALALLIWGISVAVSRVVLGLHHAADIVVGLLIGAAIGALLVLLL
jgi:undecaprenyl-diphosphatase